MIIMGIDPGYAIVGYGVVSGAAGRYQLVTYGAVTTKAGVKFEKRLCDVYDGVTALLTEYRPEAIAIEHLYFHTNQKTVIYVAEARGVILLAAEKFGVPIFEYTPLQVKTSVTGYGRAQKPQIMEMTKRLLKLDSVPKPDDAADALAMAICHGQVAGTKRRMMGNGG